MYIYSIQKLMTPFIYFIYNNNNNNNNNNIVAIKC